MQVRKGFLINISALFHFQGQSFKMMTLISHFLLFPITIFSSYPWLYPLPTSALLATKNAACF